MAFRWASCSTRWASRALSGEGSISGEVPVTIFPGGIAIPDAKLAATAPGVLRYDRNQAPLALQSAGNRSPWPWKPWPISITKS